MEGATPELATEAGATETETRKRLSKTGDTPYCFDALTIHMEDGLFIPVSHWNELRRDAIAQYMELVLASYRRELVDNGANTSSIYQELVVGGQVRGQMLPLTMVSVQLVPQWP